MYAKGMFTRNIEDYMRDIYDIDGFTQWILSCDKTGGTVKIFSQISIHLVLIAWSIPIDQKLRLDMGTRMLP